MNTPGSMRGKSGGLVRNGVRPIALAIVFASLGFLLRFLLNLAIDSELSVMLASILNFGLAAMGAFVVFPKRIKQPFGEVPLAEYLRNLGFFLPYKAWNHVVLGAALALCTLGGMLVGSLLTGRFVLDWSQLNLERIVFSLNPGVWEEFFFRGIIMLVLLQQVRSLKQAALVQILLFGLLHIKGLEGWAWVDVFSLMILAALFTYVAYKTRTLVAGIVFHFLHDALLYVVQVPGGEFFGWRENLTFYAALWTMVGVACWLTKIVAERLGVQAETELYRNGSPRAGVSAVQTS